MVGSPIDVTVDEYRGGEGPPLVLIHGGTACWQHWETTIPLLTPHFDVLAPAMPGHQGGVPLAGPATPEVLADGVEAAMDRAGFDTAHIAGNSVGGWVAAELVRRGRARSAVLLSPAGGWTPPARRMHLIFKSQDAQLKLFRPVLPTLVRSGAARRLAFHLMLQHGERMTAAQALRVIDGAIAADIDNLEGLLAVRMEPVPDPGVPVLIGWSEKDRLLPMPGYCTAWRTGLPYAERRLLRGVGHLPMIDDPGLVARTISEWAQDAEAAQGPAA